MVFQKLVFLCVAVVCGINCNPLDVSDTKKEHPDTTLYEIDEQGKHYVLSDDKLTWTDARDSCLKKGMVLASPNKLSDQINMDVYIHVNDLVPADKYSGYWLGGHRDRNDEWFNWETTGTAVNKFGWCIGEPSSFPGENCIELKSDYGRLRWNNYYCSEKKRYICEFSENSLHENLKNEEFYQGIRPMVPNEADKNNVDAGSDTVEYGSGEYVENYDY